MNFDNKIYDVEFTEECIEELKKYVVWKKKLFIEFILKLFKGNSAKLIKK